MSSLPPPPQALSLLLAETHISDARTGQNSLIGILDHVHGNRYPVMLTRLCIFAELTNGRGTVPVSMRIIDADEARPPVLTGNMEVAFPDPLAVSQLAFGAGGVLFPEPGEYRVQLLSGGHLLLERRLVLILDKPPEQRADTPT
jgi:hypothetical protein